MPDHMKEFFKSEKVKIGNLKIFLKTRSQTDLRVFMENSAFNIKSGKCSSEKETIIAFIEKICASSLEPETIEKLKSTSFNTFSKGL